MNTLSVDKLYDRDYLIDTMLRYCASESMLCGKTSENEDCFVSVTEDCVCVEVFQKNGWVRKLVFWKDGNVEDIMDGKW